MGCSWSRAGAPEAACGAVGVIHGFSEVSLSLARLLSAVPVSPSRSQKSTLVLAAFGDTGLGVGAFAASLWGLLLGVGAWAPVFPSAGCGW